MALRKVREAWPQAVSHEVGNTAHEVRGWDE